MLTDQSRAGVVRVGEPEFSDFRTTVDADAATSLVCMDESGWGMTKNGEPLELPTGIEPMPFAATLEKLDSGWIVTDLTVMEGSPCPWAGGCTSCSFAN